MQETGTVETAKLVHANANRNEIDFVVFGFAKGTFMSSRRRVRVISLESRGKGAITSVTAEVLQPEETSSGQGERIKHTLNPFVKEFILMPVYQQPQKKSGEATIQARKVSKKVGASQTGGAGKKTVTRRSFDLTQLNFLRRALVIFSLIGENQRSISCG